MLLLHETQLISGLTSLDLLSNYSRHASGLVMRRLGRTISYPNCNENFRRVEGALRKGDPAKKQRHKQILAEQETNQKKQKTMDTGFDVALEVFISRSLISIENLPASKQLNTFAVILWQAREDATFDEIARTETCVDSFEPNFCTSAELKCDGSELKSGTLRIDLYIRLYEGNERLAENEHLGYTEFALMHLVNSPDQRMRSRVLHAKQATDDIGFIETALEFVASSDFLNENIDFDVSSSLLRKREWPNKIVPQQFAMFRAHGKDTDDDSKYWLPIYRSDRVGKTPETSTDVTFSPFTVSKRQLCNGDEERSLKLSLLGAMTGNAIKKSSSHRQITELAYVELTLRNVCEIDPTKDSFVLESVSIAYDEIGRLVVLQAEPTDFGSHFAFKFELRSTSAFLSTDCNDRSGTITNSIFRKSKMHMHNLQQRIGSKRNKDRNVQADHESSSVPPSPAQKNECGRFGFLNSPDDRLQANEKETSILRPRRDSEQAERNGPSHSDTIQQACDKQGQRRPSL